MNKKIIFILIGGSLTAGAAYYLLNSSFKTAPVLPPTVPAVHASAVPTAVGAPQAMSTETSLFKALLSKGPDGRSTLYEVKKGDSLTTIAKGEGTTVELLKKINALFSDRLSIGQKLKIPSYKFNLVIDKSQNTLILKGDEEVLKTYVVSTGKDNSTPVGTFQVTDKLVNPTWYKAGAVVPYGSPDNVLGTRWIGITKKSYGIHGTTEPERLGQQVTAGCIRMKNEEVEELYAFVRPGTEVTIVD